MVEYGDDHQRRLVALAQHKVDVAAIDIHAIGGVGEFAYLAHRQPFLKHSGSGLAAFGVPEGAVTKVENLTVLVKQRLKV